VEKRRARGASSIRQFTDGTQLYSRYEIVRLPRSGTNEEEIVLGIVTDRYQPLQNADAFGFFDPVVDRKTACFETAGALGDGERVWVMAKMPDLIRVGGRDECQKYLLLSNTHSGNGSVIVKFTAVRVVCQNTLLLALDDGQDAFHIRHSKVMGDRLREVGDLIAAANEVYKVAAALFDRLAATKIGAERLHDYLEAVYPRSRLQRERGDNAPKWGHVKRLLEEISDLQDTGIRGTLWAAYNAITRFEDYRCVDGEMKGARLDRVWFGRSAAVKAKALLAAADMATKA
jgi:phage/plasmid-like protein (TIGR03299 family)